MVWILLTMGDRPDELLTSVRSIRAGSAAPIVVFVNGADQDPVERLLGSDGRVHIVGSRSNLGVPGGRAAAVEALGGLDLDPDILCFLDDDAALDDSTIERSLVARFASDDALAVVGLRIVSPTGDTLRRHVPRVGRSGTARSGRVAYFLGGACAMRHDAYRQVGGYWPDLWYGHEELDLSWRLHDAGWAIWYAADSPVVHPHTSIERHEGAWELTGRNRVAVARRNLPAMLVVIHTGLWLLIGLVRARRRGAAAYLRGYRRGLRMPVDRRPMRWRTVVTLSRLGRPPIV